jgi:2'-5' RNA ligase
VLGVIGGRTSLLVIVAEAESAVGQLRLQFDPVARLGIPAHLTILFPFMPASEIHDDVISRLAALFHRVPAFKHTFVRTAWFGDEAVWLAPEAADVFRSLTRLVWAAFPAYPPFEGQFDDIVPHVTIADHGALDEMQSAERAVQRHLPISAVTRTVTLMVEQPSGRWEAAESFALNE